MLTMTRSSTQKHRLANSRLNRAGMSDRPLLAALVIRRDFPRAADLFASGARLLCLILLALCLTLLAWPGPVRAQRTIDTQIEQVQLIARQDPNAAITRLDELIGADAAVPSPVDQARLLALRAELYRDRGELEQARADAAQARELAMQSGEIDILAESLRVLGTIQAEAGQVSTALEYFHEGWMLVDDQSTSRVKLRLAIALGVGHQMLENHSRAIVYLERALDLARRLHDRAQEATILGNLAIARCQTEGLEASLALHEQALAIFKEIDHPVGIATQLANICDRCAELVRTDRALAACQEAETRLTSLGNVRLLAGVRGVLGTIYQQQGNLDAALGAYLQALELAEGRIPTVERDLLERLAGLHIQRSEPEQALAVYQRYLAVREVLWEERNRQTVEELEVQYELRERERELRLAQAESELQSIRLNQQSRRLIFALLALILLVILFLILLRNNREWARLQTILAERNRELEEAVQTIGQLATRDPLTELCNRRAFINLAGQEMARARRNGHPIGVLMVDIDHFKHLNDEHGHAIGDLVLKEIANVLRTHLREPDIPCRWGGEEFVILLPDTGPEEALKIAERARQAIDQTTIEVDGSSLHVTVTIGVAALEEDLDRAIDAADQAMYAGKAAGRNRVMLERRS